MRTLVIDNYDSFTHNLVQYVAMAGGEPTVVRNDDPAWDPGSLRGFDNVVISPGPGRPDREADFGICAEVIEHARVPLLGVCLGHQGICHRFGARVVPAPEVRHGRPSLVEHSGDALFRGVPSPFSAVRYHSLTVEGLPPVLEPIAWADDGVLMGVRHRERPMWGVQFHPESVRTEHGQRIIGNFMELTAGRRGRPARARRPAAAPRPPAPDTEGAAYQVIARRLAVPVDPEVAFEALFGASGRAFWLDSSLTGERGGRFSFMGDASGPLARVVTADVWTGRLSVESAGGRTELSRASFFDWIEKDLRSHRTEVPDLPFGFALGWVGYLGYELKAECGGARAHRSPHPDAAMIFADRAVAFDHADGTVHLLALCRAGAERDARAWLEETASRLAVLAGLAPREPSPVTAVAGPPALRHDRARYLDMIETCLREIAAGETYEVCLTNLMSVPARIPPWDLYRRLRRSDPVPFGALLRLPGLSVLSSSPERFLRVSADGTVESKPIKGTRPRGLDPAEDRRLRAELAASVKDRAENLMIVDLVRHDLGMAAEVGSVTVDPIFAVESYATVHQLVSTVRARLRPGVSAVACVRAAFPGGSMTGAPKIRTMEIIDRLEAGPRGVYSGAIGYFSLSGAADLSIVIRTAVASAGRIDFGVGGAVTALSDPAEEFEETAVKAAPLLRLLGTPFPGMPATTPPPNLACGATR
ncbi:aminodeoxychorismate synthase, component I [Actinomadura sp. NBRC 104412]|uniref:aminodeoxychorismate synthase component I n=1 Tax=Actinomadura sp. NBRC 104412 TaxID=3032203 RepID=UPI0024A60085|nr:aminodeoxychorismate synthase component I [Actinomadura sp. NBRC 104412]GLZ09413.1 aminodeoxychorismate synthase, component I [Actinomadura sp. NBRC 104412]